MEEKSQTLSDRKAVLNHKNGAGVYYESDIIKSIKNIINKIELRTNGDDIETFEVIRIIKEEVGDKLYE